MLALSGQGRQALLVTVGGVGLSVFMLFALSTILTGIYARLILDSAHLSARPNQAKRYAQRCAPELLAVSACFALPLLLRYATNMDLRPTITISSQGISTSIGWLVQVLPLIAPFGVVSPALGLSDSPLKLSFDETIPLVLIVIVYVVTFLAMCSGPRT